MSRNRLPYEHSEQISRLRELAGKQPPKEKREENTVYGSILEDLDRIAARRRFLRLLLFILISSAIISAIAFLFKWRTYLLLPAIYLVFSASSALIFWMVKNEKIAGAAIVQIITVIIAALTYTYIYTIEGIIIDGNHVYGFGECLYFSFVTLTTLGYGDFRPCPESRIYAASEAFLGYVLLGLLISLLAHNFKCDYLKFEGRTTGRD